MAANSCDWAESARVKARVIGELLLGTTTVMLWLLAARSE